MARSYLVNAVDVELAAPVAAPDLTITVDDAAPLPTVPFYLVVDPFSSTNGREYMLCTNVAGVVLTVTRSLDGSEADTHPAGDVVRISYVAQILDDLWDEIENVSSLPAGGVIGDSLRKESSTDGDADWRANVTLDIEEPTSPILGDIWMDPDAVLPSATYMRLDGTTAMNANMDLGTHRIINVVDPTDVQDAATKNYVDTQITSNGLNFLRLDGTSVMTGPLIHAAGSESAPSLSFAAEPTTGIYQGSAATISFSISGTRMLLLTSVGLSGLVTGTPGMKLDAAGTAATPAYGFVGDPGLGIYRADNDELSFAVLATPKFTLTSADAAFATNITFPAYGEIGLRYDNQGISLNLGSKEVADDGVIPFIDFFGGSEEISARIILSAKETGTSRSGGLRYEASQGHNFVGPVLADDGDTSAPSLSFRSRPDIGWYTAGGQIYVAVAGIQMLWAGGSNWYVDEGVNNHRWRGINAYPTTSSAANIFCDTGSQTGYVRRYTSSEVFKRDINRDLASHLAALPIPPAARWKDKDQDAFDLDGTPIDLHDDTEFVGYIAEDWASLDSRLVMRNDEDDIDNIHDRSIMALIGEHVRALETRVDELENA